MKKIIILLLCLVILPTLVYADFGSNWEETENGAVKIYSKQIAYYDNGWKKINTNIGTSNCDTNYNYCIDKNLYQVHYKTDPSTAQSVKFVEDDYWITHQPHGLNYRNDLDQIQQISTIQSVTGYPNNNIFTYDNAFGPNIDLTYEYQNEFLKEKLIINSFSDLPILEQYIINGGNPTLDLDFVLDFPNDVDIYIDNVKWDKGSTKTTDNAVIFKNSTTDETLNFYLPKPYANDSANFIVPLKYMFKKTGSKLYVTVKTNYSWLQLATFPIMIDPSISVSSIDDSSFNIAFPDANYGNLAFIGVNSRVAGGLSWMLLKFNLTDAAISYGFSSVESANLSLYYETMAGNGPYVGIEDYSIYNVTNHTWNETEVTWNDQPTHNTTPSDNVTINISYVDRELYYGYYNWSIGTDVNASLGADNITSWMIKPTVNDSHLPYEDTVWFGSKENTLNHEPYLILVFEGIVPKYNNSGVNQTQPNVTDTIKYYTLWHTENGQSLNYSIFSENSSGTWTNRTAVVFSPTNDSWSNATMLINASQKNVTFSARFYANDTLGLWNATNLINVTVNATFTFNITSNNYTSPLIESQDTAFNISFTTLSDVDYINASLIWNGTNYGYDNYTVDGSNITIDQSIDIPLIDSNATNISFYWTYNITYTDLSVESYNSSIQNQTILFGYYWSDALGNVTTTYEGEGFRFNSTLTELISVATISNKTAIFNSSFYTPIISGTLHYRDIGLPYIDTTTTFNFSFSMEITFNGTTKTRSSAEGNVTVNAVLLNNTAGTGYCEVMRFDYWDEENVTKPINATMDMYIRLWKNTPDSYKEFNFSYSTNHSHYLYINPCNATRYAFSIQDYEQDGDVDGIIYPERHYFLLGTELSNTSHQVTDLYLLNSTYADVIGFTVNNMFAEGVPDIVIVAQRFYTAENTYRTVAMGYTDSDGNTHMRLYKSTGEDDIWYRFLLYQDYTLVKTFQNTHVIADILVLPLETAGLTEFWNYFNEVAYTCSYNNATRLLLCEYQEGSELLQRAELYVRQIETVGYTEICNVTSTSSSATLSCDLSAEDTDGTFEWWLEFTYEETVYTIVKNIIQPLADVYSESGIFAAFLLFLACVGLGTWRPEAMLIMGIFGLIIGFMLSLAIMGIVGLVSIIIAIILFLVKVGEN